MVRLAGSAISAISTFRSSTARILPNVKAARRACLPMGTNSCSRKIVGPTGSNMWAQDELIIASCSSGFSGVYT